MRILVTGGAGFIGSSFIRHGIGAGHEIINLDLLTYASCLDNVKLIESNENYTFIKGDIRDKELVESLLNKYKPSHIINLAAESHVDRSIDSASEVLSTNIMGTYCLLDAFRHYYSSENNDCRFLHVSTDEVYGTVQNNIKFTEQSNYYPSNPYSASKASSDHLVRAWGNTYNLPVLITNCSNNYGPYQFPEKLIPVIILNSLNQREIGIYGNGQQIRDWIYVDDHTEGLLMVLEKGISGSTYNIGSNHEMSNIELTKKICNILDNKLKPKKSFSELITYVDDRPGHDTHYAIDSSKIIGDLGWKPNISLHEGLVKTIDWYLNNQDWLFELEKREGVGNRLGLSRAKNK